MTIFNYQLVRSKKRRTISLQVKSGEVRVLAPEFVPQNEIDALVKKKSAWLADKVAIQIAHKKNIKIKQFVSGEIFYYLGESLVLRVNLKPLDCYPPSSQESIKQQGNELDISITNTTGNTIQQSALVKEQLFYWYQIQAKRVLVERFEYLQQKLGLYAEQLTIRHYKTRWGSCDNKKRVKLNWLLIMAPMYVIDYVIIHELCHLVYLNHSTHFWNLVHSHTAYHKKSKIWLKEHHQDLSW